MIDATNTSDITTRRVVFAEKQNSKPSDDMFKTERPRLRRPKSAKARLSRSTERTNNDRNKTFKVLELDQYKFPDKSRKSKTESEASSERSRQRSASRERSDHRLKNTENEKILDWLKKKEKMQKTKYREERKERKKKKDEQKQEDQKKQDREKQSDKKVKVWMDKKKKEYRLLSKRDRETHRALNRGGELPASDNIVTAVELDKVKEEHKPNCQILATTTSNDSSVKLVVCTCGFVEGKGVQRRVKTYNINRQKSAGPRIPRAKSPKKAERTSQSSSNENSLKLSYDDWLKSKENETHERKKINMKGSPVDVSTDELITDIGQKRFDMELKIEHDATVEQKELAVRPTSSMSNAAVDSGSARDLMTPTPSETIKSPVSIKNRPKSGRPPTAVAIKSPASSAEPITPRPKTPVTSAYQKVKRERKSWEDFADNVWKQVNEDERPEPQGSDNPDDHLGNEVRNSYKKDTEDVPTKSEDKENKDNNSSAHLVKPSDDNIKRSEKDQKNLDKMEPDEKEHTKKDLDVKESVKKDSDEKESGKKDSDEKESDKKDSDEKESDKKDSDEKDTDEEDKELKSEMNSVMGDIMRRSESRLSGRMDDSFSSSSSDHSSTSTNSSSSSSKSETPRTVETPATDLDTANENNENSLSNNETVKTESKTDEKKETENTTVKPESTKRETEPIVSASLNKAYDQVDAPTSNTTQTGAKQVTFNLTANTSSIINQVSSSESSDDEEEKTENSALKPEAKSDDKTQGNLETAEDSGTTNNKDINDNKVIEERQVTKIKETEM